MVSGNLSFECFFPAKQWRDVYDSAGTVVGAVRSAVVHPVFSCEHVSDPPFLRVVSGEGTLPSQVASYVDSLSVIFC